MSARSFTVLLPRLNRAEAGVVFAAGNFVRREGVVPAALMAARLNGGSIGVHAAPNGGTHSLCALPLKSETKADGTLRVFDSCKSAGKSGSALQRVASHVTCKFCQARLVSAGVMSAESATAYAADYGTRDAAAEMTAIEQRAAAAAKAAAKAAKS